MTRSNFARTFVVLALVSTSACTKGSGSPTAPSDGVVCSGGTCVPPSQNILVPGQPATQTVGDQQVTLKIAVGNVTGPGQVLYCDGTTTGDPRALGSYAEAADGSRLAGACVNLWGTASGGFYPLNGFRPMVVVIYLRADVSVSARWEVKVP